MFRAISWFLFLQLVFLSVGCTSPYQNITVSDLTDSKGWIVFDDFKYRGELRGGMPNGNGEVVFNNGSSAKGYFRNGVLEGHAEVYIPRKGSYVGDFSNGRLTYGTIRFDNGDFYQGHIQNYSSSGYGFFVSATGNIQVGVIGDRASGQLIEYLSDNNVVIYSNRSNGRRSGPALIEGEGLSPEAYYFEDGLDITDRYLSEKAKEEVEAVQADEIARAERRISIEESRLEEAKERFEAFQQEETVDYRICNCRLHLSLCLSSTGDGERIYYAHDYFEYDDPGYLSCSVTLPYGATDSEVRSALRKEMDLVRECRVWNSDRAGYEGALMEKQTQLRSTIDQVARNVAERERDLEELRAYQRRSREALVSQARVRQQRALKNAADAIKAEIEASCAQSPNSCVCMTAEELRRCAQQEHATCVCSK